MRKSLNLFKSFDEKNKEVEKTISFFCASEEEGETVG